MACGVGQRGKCLAHPNKETRGREEAVLGSLCL